MPETKKMGLDGLAAQNPKLDTAKVLRVLEVVRQRREHGARKPDYSLVIPHSHKPTVTKRQADK
jgi:hypothetical protein